MTKGLPCLLLFIFFINCSSYAQKRVVRGTVNSATDKSGLAGVSILLKGAAKGTETDGNGSFEIATDAPNPVIMFSSVGFERKKYR